MLYRISCAVFDQMYVSIIVLQPAIGPNLKSLLHSTHLPDLLQDNIAEQGLSFYRLQTPTKRIVCVVKRIHSISWCEAQIIQKMLLFRCFGSVGWKRLKARCPCERIQSSVSSAINKYKMYDQKHDEQVHSPVRFKMRASRSVVGRSPPGTNGGG